MPRIAGIDLAASERRVSGIAVLDPYSRAFLYVGRVYSDEEILGVVEGFKASIAVIDAPLSPPPPGEAFRRVEREAIKRGARLLPLNMPSMRMLLERAMRLSRRLREEGLSVYETHPWSALRLSGCSFSGLLSRLGLRVPGDRLSSHERDAILAAVVGYCILHSCADRVEAGGETLYLLRRVC